MGDGIKSFSKDFMLLCSRNAEKEMIIYDAGNGIKRFSYDTVFHECRRFLKFFEQNHLKKGDTVVTVMPNSPEAVICFFSAVLAGINYAPLPCTVTRREYNSWISLVHPEYIIKKTGIADFDTEVPVFDCSCDGNLCWLPQEEKETVETDAPQVYLMTSGTTGTPKAMSINADKLWSSGAAFTEFYGINKSAFRFWNYLPMSYLGGLFNLALIPLNCSGSFVISEPFSGKTILNYWFFVEKHKINALWLVPSIVQGLLKLSKMVVGKRKNTFSEAIRIAFLGTAPIQLAQKREFEKVFGVRLYENYALSESTFLTAETEKDIRFREQGSVGNMLPYIQMKFIPVDGISDINMIWIKTPYLFDGYLSADGKLELETDADGFFNTKDLGFMNDDKVLVLGGRSRDIIKKGGQFVSLTEIEQVVTNTPWIEEAAAVPVEHEFYGEAYILCVVFYDKTNREDQIKRLHVWMLENFVPYKMPERILYLDELPRSSSGKILKQEIIKSTEYCEI